MIVATNAQMRALDAETIKTVGIPSMVLMERAGLAVAEYAKQLSPQPPKKALILCGKGNNGGDGMVVARLLRNEGWSVDVRIVGNFKDLSRDSAEQLRILNALGIECRPFEPSMPLDFGLIIDALLGTGLAGEVSGALADCISRINTADALKLSVDIPSGIDGDTGQIRGIAVKATATIALGLPKLGHYLYPGSEYAGKVKIADIGIPPVVIEKEDLRARITGSSELREMLPQRSLSSHKGNNGRILIIGGSVGMVGAPVIAGLSALRVGAGLVTLAVPKSVQPIIASSRAELMTLPAPDDDCPGYLTKKGLSTLLNKVNEFDVIAVGPGLSTNLCVRETMELLFASVAKPLIIDADALNCLADMNNAAVPNGSILTPHPGEAARLLKQKVDWVQNNRLVAAENLAQRYKSIAVLKSRHTIIHSFAGDIWFNPTGNPGMATAGMGDALTGIIAGLMGQNIAPLNSAVAGVYMHGAAGDLAAEQIGAIGYTAIDVANKLPAVRDKIAMEEI